MAPDPFKFDTHVNEVKPVGVAIGRANRAAGDLASAANIIRLYTSDTALARLLDATAEDVRTAAARAEIVMRENRERRRRENI